jgi:hypothetical protein
MGFGEEEVAEVEVEEESERVLLPKRLLELFVLLLEIESCCS